MSSQDRRRAGFKDQPSREVLERVLSARGLVAVRIEHSAVEHLRADRRAAR